MINKPGRVQLTPSMIPNSPNFNIEDSTFFGKWSQLPSPKEVRAQAEAQHLLGVNPDNRKVHSSTAPSVRPPPVIFGNMRLFIKWESAVGVSEAQYLYAVRQFLQDDVPVPEVYDWRTDGDEKFIYMEYIEGQTLEKVWDVMEPSDRVSICHELRTNIRTMWGGQAHSNLLRVQARHYDLTSITFLFALAAGETAGASA
ncbi:hypothetical protein BDV26DRAFT_262940 [Aspergillus bertholletiae]|uniref:Aminoglycoside phosphotransferase domain-containing protein n=1 Tax=Aspergillus bertholletiae TaxID=1226010 RepID=A0A5N7B7R2_9EURO|nr:hypothetical protein BDV26DRAFT_262940 [Aspergillus bertholletiae]